MSAETEKVFYFEPDWTEPFKLRYVFQTALFQNERNKESREALVKSPPPLVLSFMNVEVEHSAPLYALIRSYTKERIYVPIFSEPIFPTGTGSLQGAASITTETRINNLNCGYISKYMLVDLRNAKDPAADGAVKAKVYSFTKPSYTALNVSSGTIGEAFYKERTVIYPAVLCVLDEKEIINSTPDMTTFNLVFKTLP